jgi:hypothetical protein
MTGSPQLRARFSVPDREDMRSWKRLFAAKRGSDLRGEKAPNGPERAAPPSAVNGDSPQGAAWYGACLLKRITTQPRA